jgi:hypothetical protein
MQFIKSLLWHALLTLAVATVVAMRPALAEFEIQEAGIEKGETEFEYRGAYHWGVPEVTDSNTNANDLVQSHEFELEYGLTDWWQVQLTLGLEQPLHENFEASEVEFETEFALIKRKGDGAALSFQVGYEQSTNGQADALGFGPIIELEYDFAKNWGVGVEMFGEIEDLANSGAFNQQNHSIGPTLFWHPGERAEEDEMGGKQDNDNDAGPSKMELSLNLGVQFGLTDAASDAALKFQGSLSF